MFITSRDKKLLSNGFVMHLTALAIRDCRASTNVNLLYYALLVNDAFQLQRLDQERQEITTENEEC
jgi:hypothetical protein